MEYMNDMKPLTPEQSKMLGQFAVAKNYLPLGLDIRDLADTRNRRLAKARAEEKDLADRIA